MCLVLNVVTHAKPTRGFLSNQQMVASDHLDAYTKKGGLVDGLLGVRAGGVEEREQAKELPLAVPVRLSNTEGSYAALA
jgi:hypothetical protein